MGLRSADGTSSSELSGFRLEDPLRLPARPGELRRTDASAPHAVLVVHGMGQQTKFETLDLLARGLLRAARLTPVGQPRARLAELGGASGRRPPDPPEGARSRAKADDLGGERLHRLELTLGADGRERELHLYEAYWAPLTEGRVTLRDVAYLLLVGVVNGVRNGSMGFERWLFGSLRQFPTQVRSVIYLLVGLLAALGLAVINLTIGVVAAARWGFGAQQGIVSDGLYGDLSTALNLLLVLYLIFGVVLGAGYLARRTSNVVRLTTAGTSVVAFVVALVGTIATGVAIPLFVFLHRQPGPTGDRPLLASALGLRLVEHFNAVVELGVVALILAVALTSFLALLVRLAKAWRRAFRDGEPRRTLTTAVVVLFALLVAGLAIEVGGLLLTDWGTAGGGAALGRGVVWLLLVIASLIVRRTIVQFIGDTAAYVQPHTLDRFQTLREEIKAAVYRTARAIYAAGEGRSFTYASVAVVGHSLGSVIAYDVLNRLINDDLLAGPESDASLRVMERTSLLLTLGSPLDKTAFVFGSQREQSETRYALAATAQPLIQRLDRPCWVNVYSPWDPISGPLGYYDPPPRRDGKPDPRAVDNASDPDARTLFRAHLEYWDGTLVFTKLLDAIASRRERLSRPDGPAAAPAGDVAPQGADRSGR